MKVLITGPESSGKSSLSRSLAWCLDGIFVAEQAREYLHGLDREYTFPDLAAIWSAQLNTETQAERSGASTLICDTGPEVIYIWSLVKFGRVAPAVEDAMRSRCYDLTLLCTPDLPWEADALREAPDANDRWALFERYRTLLPHAIIIRGDDRIRQALQAVSGIR
ncbi:nicotinamide riboside kinase [Neolewinella xylanilytica]|uniref:Nicotinamide riboside kinase n=1 Tax=Neolewinella xylanilytica TaxID=1514080 RepID=A0A2S6I502_9BACT|nr:AAA family ATPase [Neolewinella xylanilytica]PPK86253.1 nicotinamide riboside kinase [Neolewinella xylanilytica]